MVEPSSRASPEVAAARRQAQAGFVATSSRATLDSDPRVEALRRLNAAAPAPLASRARKARLVGERKPVTAIFADIVGSTSLAERIDPEDWVEVINTAFDALSRCIFDYEGTIAQLLGDAIVGFFGAPVAHEDDPERAVRAALDMTAAMETYGAELRRSHGIDFRIRVGISTGPVLVGNVGSDLRYDYTAIGDTMNISSRLQGEAPPGGILISDRTERFVRPLFELEDVGALDLKGKTEAVRAYRVLGLRHQPGPTRGLAGLASPMVGREAELASLVQLARTIRAGRGRVAVVIAEPGLGKSRLLAEARAAVADREADTAPESAPTQPERTHPGRGTSPTGTHATAETIAGAGPTPGSDTAAAEAGWRETAWVTGRAVSFGARLPFHVVNSLLLDVLGMREMSDPVEADAALRHTIAELAIDPAEVYPFLAYQMGLPLPPGQDAEMARISADLLAERIGAALLQLLKAVASQGPLVVAIEDTHWADRASVTLIKSLLTLADEAAVLLICTTRDEPLSPGWGVVTAARARVGRALTEIRLTPLDRDHSTDLVANLLEIESLPASTRGLILAKAEGNPFFVEEVIRMLIDGGVIARRDDRWVATATAGEVQIPDTLNGLILARIDRLPDHARRLLRLASCIDRQFAVPLLEDVARSGGLGESVGEALGRLEAANLLTLAATDPDVEYRFSHALIQDAAYESMLRQERREWHLTVAAALLDRYPDRAAEFAGRLAHHFEQGGDQLKAVRYLVIEAERAMARAALVDAQSLFEHAYALLAPVSDEIHAQPLATPPEELHERLRLSIRVALGRVAAGFAFVKSEEALAIVREARAMAERLADDAAIADLLRWEVFFRRAQGEQPSGSPGLAAALDRLDSLPAADAADVHLALTLFETGRMLLLRGEYAASLASLEQATEAMARRGDAIGMSMAEGYKGANLASQGDFAGAEEHLRRAYKLATGADRLAMVDYRLAEATVRAVRGDFQASARISSDCLETATDLGALSCATISGVVLGGAQLATGHGLLAQRTLERSVELADQGFLAPLGPRASAFLASALGASGDLERSDQGFQSAIRELTRMSNPHNLAEARLLRGLMLAQRPAGDAAEALRDVELAQATFESLGARPDLARALRARGTILGQLDRLAEADEALAAAAAMAAEMGLLDGPWPRDLAELQALRRAAPPIEPLD
jgi:class 3 adenylate cyclase/tetratricopeptide (TPR) repeat protein